MSGNQEPVEESHDDRIKPQRDKNGNEDPAVMPVEDVIIKEEEQEETEYYEEGNGGATD